MNNHPYHLVDKSPWPLFGSISIMSMVSGLALWFCQGKIEPMILSFIILLLMMFQWWRDVIRESTFQGLHTKKVILSMKIGMVMFIVSEIMFFLSFFWAFLNSSLSPNIEIGLLWPPKSVKSFNPLSIPLLNTMILLSSGISLTWAHNSLLMNNFSQTVKSMIITVILGVYFSLLQLFEYYNSSFSISDSIYGSTFFLSTGFHGIHVIIGTLFILTSMIRMSKLHMSKMHHLGFEASAWYWHFVDVVWLFLYIMIYWWGE
uniref:cytochrome c oxidase subunit 3 n=1 Tax=Multinervis guangxiensis TaxID=1792637 RepID=UPI0030022C6E|nr:cytochrome c oxidase subunit 3 [Multinervis guangxiensis]